MHQQLTERVTRTYHDRDYQHAAVVNHRGTLVAFAMDAHRRIHYSVLDLEGTSSAGIDADVDAWLPDPRPLPFPAEVVQVGFGSLASVTMPTVQLGSRKEVEPDAVEPELVDRFLSTTARLGDDVPFQVLSDATHVYVFRQAVAGDHADAVHKLAVGGASGRDGGRADDAFVLDAGARVPVVDRTLLVDRYLLTGTELVLPRDVRFRRSRNPVRPASGTDSLGAKDMEGRPFVEPTRELDLVGQLHDGRFAVLLLPTIVADVQRWQLFRHDAPSGDVVAHNLARDAKGWFQPASPEGDDDEGPVRFRFAAHDLTGGLAACLYHEQEEVAGSVAPRHVSQHARVLVCAVATPAGSTSDDHVPRPHVMAVDLAVTKAGRLSRLPEQRDGDATTVVAVPSVGDDLPDAAARDRVVTEIDTLEASLAKLAPRIATLEAGLSLDADNPVAPRRKRVDDQLATLDRGDDRLAALAREITAARARKKAADRIRGATFFQNRGKQGKQFRLVEGQEVSDLDGLTMIKDTSKIWQQNNSRNWQDEISSIGVDAGAKVEVFQQEKFRTDASHAVFEADVDFTYAGTNAAWNDDIESVRVSASDTLTAERTASAAALKTLVAEKEALDKAAAARAALEKERDDLRRLAEARADRDDEQARLAALRATPVVLPQPVAMPEPWVEGPGLSVTSASLAFAWTGAQPHLLTSAAGRVKLAFTGVGGQFFAADYDVRTAPARWHLPTDGAADLVATAPPGAAGLETLRVRIAPAAQADRCAVHLDDPAGTWTFALEDSPRAGQRLGEAVNAALIEAFPDGPPLLVDVGTSEGRVVDGSTTVTSARRPRWVADHPGRSLALDGAQVAMTREVTGLARDGDVTVEGWLRPTSADEARVLHVRDGDDQFGLGCVPRIVRSGLAFEAAGSVEVPTLDARALQQGFTLEAWVRLDGDHDREQPIVGSLGKGSSACLHFVVRSRRPYLGFWGNDLATPKDVAALESDRWYHVAATWEPGVARVLYLDGKEVARDTPSQPFVGTGPLHLGRDYGASLYGALDHVRIWSVARSSDDIALHARREVTGGQRGLLGSWSFGDGDVRDHSGSGHHGVLSPELRATRLVEGPLPAVAWKAGVGDVEIEAVRPRVVGSWQHVAAVYEESHALRFAGDARANAGHNVALDLADDLTIEAVVRLDRLGRPHGIMGKGDPANADAEGVPFALHVDVAGHLVFTHGDSLGTVEHRSAMALQAGVLHRVAVVRKVGRQKQEHRGKKTIEMQVPKKDDPKETETKQRTFDVVDSVTLVDFEEVHLVIDGTAEPVIRRDRGTSRGNDADVMIGTVATLHDGTAQLQGELCELRLWHRAREEAHLGTTPGRDEAGLAAWWRLEEPGAHVASDHAGNNDAILRGPTWLANPDPKGPRFELFVDGSAVTTTRRSGVDVPAGPSHAALGGRLVDDGTSADHFTGEMDEVRLWKTVRTPEQLLDQMFGRLRSGRRDLAACWSFDDGAGDGAVVGTPTDVRDSGPRGNDLDLLHAGDGSAFGLSTAPISTDAAEVRPALAGIRTTFHAQVDGRVGVAEYADLERTADGSLAGVQKRCYVSTRGGRWHLAVGYEVGDLVTEWVGQAQFAPQVVGYIEGAPPVPGENLTENNLGFESFTGAAEVTLREVEDVVLTTSSSREESYRTGFEGEASMGSKGKLSVVVAPMGVGVSEEMEFEVASDLRLGMETAGTWGGSESSSAGQSVSRLSTAALGGRWDSSDPKKWRNPDLTLRFVPANTGFAFVESATADVFALRLRHTGTVVALRMLPNPDIPRDTNVIPFPLNPRYTKQGTLDGKIGLRGTGEVVLDHDYPNAAQLGEHSYFKPKEAYALKRRIERQQQEARAFFDTFETTPSGARMLETLRPSLATLAGAGAAGVLLGGSFAVPVLAGATLAAGIGTTIASAVQFAAKDDDLVEKFAARDLVNTYVWTAAGGFFAEATDVSRVRSSSTSGSYDLSGSASGGFGGGVSGPVSFSLGLTGTMSGSIHETRSADRETSETFGLDVSVDVPRDLQAYTYGDDAGPGDGATGVYDAQGRPVEQVGKVDAYRFLTFYLEPRRSNFTDLFDTVVDPQWLQTDAPNAAALREANQGERQPTCWRVMHRVTFVSRILPEFAATAPAAAQRRVPDLSSDYELVRRLEPEVRSHVHDVRAFERAVATAVRTHLPELAGADDLEAVTDVMAAYFGVDRDAMAP